MGIISISVDDDLLNQIDTFQKEFNFSGRSDLFRAALTNLVSDFRQKQKLVGIVDAVLVIIHQKQNNEVSKLMHKYSFLIKTQMHSHTQNKKCQELFLLSGDSKKIKELYEELTTNRKIDLAKLIIA